VIFARSNRPAILLGALLVAGGALLAASALRILAIGGEPGAALLFGLLAIVDLAYLARLGRHLRKSRPGGRLGFFADRLVLVQGATALQVPWNRIEVASLADQTDWALARWPEIRLTDRLTIRVRAGRSFSFRPDGFGVDAVACRDLVLRLRDDPRLRRRLPEFDSRLDLAHRPLSRGDLIKQLI
jgi:hypothetical protein